MKPKNLEEIWDAETYYDELRWSTEYPFEQFNDQELDELRRDLSETISALSNWLNRKLLSQKRKRITTIRRKLVDFRWYVVEETQSRQRKGQHFQRLDNLIEPQPRVMVTTPTPYGLRQPLKGSDFFRDIPRIFAPRPKTGRL